MKLATPYFEKTTGTPVKLSEKLANLGRYYGSLAPNHENLEKADMFFALSNEAKELEKTA